MTGPASAVAATRLAVRTELALLPEGSVLQVDGVPERYRGIYTVMDTGPKVQGRHVDIYMWNCDEAVQFGRRQAALTILRLGWSPKNSALSIK